MSTALQTLRQRWSALSARERRALGLAGVTLGLALVWAEAVQPAWRTIRTAPAQQAALDAAWQQMQRDADETRRLRALPPVAPALAAQALQAATARLGDTAKLSLQGERAVLTVDGAPGEAIVQWLTEVRQGARARAVEANLEARPDADRAGYRGRITVTIGAGA